MFLKQLIRQNKQLVDFSIASHQIGELLPDTYVLDVDSILKNADMILKHAKANGLRCVYMSKQLGRNPMLCKKIEDLGYDGAVAVDFKEAISLANHGLKLYNIGHLVQTPKHALEKLMLHGVEYITVYSLDKLIEINELAIKHGIHQKVMLKVLDHTCVIYDGQYGGFNLEQVQQLIPKIKSLTSIRLRGVTSFPCFVYDNQQKEIIKTRNLDLVMEVKNLLEQYDFIIDEVNLPSANTSSSMQYVKELGGTTVEPGHALSGTTPYHVDHEEYEKIALIYLSEISHVYQGDSFCFGGGHYRRSNLKNVMIAHQGNFDFSEIYVPAAESIDYYFRIKGVFPIGASVVTSFRTQIFTTRSHVALVEGLTRNNPKIIGLFDSQGNQI